jgi:hypothetical protein
MTSSINLPLIVIPLTIPVPSQTSGFTTTTTLTPPPIPWSQTTPDPELNTKTTTFRPGSISPPCATPTDCGGPCLTCLPFGEDSGGGGGGGVGGGGGGGGGDEESSTECSTETATICTTDCIVSQTCGYDCTTTDGCGVTDASTTTIGTPPPGASGSWELWPATMTDDPSVDASLEASLNVMLNSLYGTLPTITAMTTSAPGPPTPTSTPENSAGDPGCFILGYYEDGSQGYEYEAWEIYPAVEPGFQPCSGPSPVWESSYPSDTFPTNWAGIPVFGNMACSFSVETPGAPVTTGGAAPTIPPGINEYAIGTLTCMEWTPVICNNYVADQNCEGDEYYNIMVECDWSYTL